MSTIISRKAKRNRRKGKDTMEKPGTRLPISYLIIIIVLSVILFGVCVVIHFSSGILDYSWTIATKDMLAFDVPILKSASRSQLAAVDPEREAGIIKVTTTTTTSAATADLEREEIERATTATTTEATTIRAGDIFVPGSLNMTRFETHQRCYVDEVLYKNHRQQPANRYVSEQHKLIYFQITKGGSSRIRKKMDDFFDNILQHPCSKMGIKQRDVTRFNNDTFHKFTFSREPTSRFVSAFFEAMLRWFTRPENIGSLVPPTKELEDFVRVYNQTYLKEDDGHVVEAFETFVTHNYDGYTLPNNHLTLQIAQIFRPKNCLRLDVIHDLENLDNVFHEMLMGQGLEAKTFQIEKEKKQTPQQRHARPSKFHLNLSRVSVEVQQKVCQLSALDYCCLNYRLPPECEGVVSCRWRETKTSPWARNLLPSNNSWATVYTNTNTNTSISTSVSTSTSINDLMLLIEPVSPYPLLPTQQQQRKKIAKKRE
mmetsp:Transcript_31063/g.34755  ORF Transcript_31063/g.34755 Transcript_31063/m.34755 type:complete len:484 (+) Transcript_31063:59-1510(+)